MLYTATKEARYADYVRTMLLQYAAMIPILKNHPQAKSSSPGRLFHQALNDCNWIVQAIQAYDAVYDALSAADKKTIEDGVFRLLAHFLTQDLESWFYLFASAIENNKPQRQIFGYRNQILKKTFYGALQLTDASDIATITFLNGNRYYSVSTTANSATEMLLTRIGANDPNFNLRNESSFLIRKKKQNAVFASVIEPHGNYDGQTENSTQSASAVDRLEVLKDDENATVVALRFKKGKDRVLCVANDSGLKTAVHSVLVNGQMINWTGAFAWRVL